MNKKQLHGLYAITDSHLIAEDTFTASIEATLGGGTSIIQYRDKSNDDTRRLAQAKQLRVLCDRFDALLIINDDIELAKKSKADGIHLGRDDSSLSEAREQLGEDIIIGISCYDDISLAIDAEKQGADYVAFGAFYSSPTKPGAKTAPLSLLQQAKAELDIPVCAIGGINSDNANALVQAGADMIAVISGIFSRPDIEDVSRQLASLF